MKKIAIPVVMIIVGILFIIAFQVFKVSVNTHEILNEPFAFLPIGYTLIRIGIVWTLVIFLCT